MFIAFWLAHRPTSTPLLNYLCYGMGLCYVYEAMIGNVSWEGVYLIVLYTVLNGKKLQVTQLLTLGVR